LFIFINNYCENINKCLLASFKCAKCVDEIMKKCFECGKELKFWEGYRHPVLGAKELVCWACFEKVDKSVEEYRNFVLDCVKREEQKIAAENINHKSRFENIWNNIKIAH